MPMSGERTAWSGPLTRSPWPAAKNGRDLPQYGRRICPVKRVEEETAINLSLSAAATTTAATSVKGQVGIQDQRAPPFRSALSIPSRVHDVSTGAGPQSKKSVRGSDVGAVPRKAGMERKDLLGINGKIFTGQGNAIAKNAANDVRVLVVGNPCNTNSLIAANNAPGVPKNRFFAMTALDENRAKSQLAKKAAVDVTAVTNLAIWGNHSATMFPDFYNTQISGQMVPSVIKDEAWLKGEFITTIQQRGAAIIKARGLSSAASAANAAVNTVYKLTHPTPAGDWFSVAVHSDGSYGIEKGLIFSYPIRSNGKEFEIVHGVPLNEFSKAKIAATENELKEEKSLVADLLPK